MSPLTVKSFPHIFKPLQWWEERNPEDMPEYLKPIESCPANYNFPDVLKVARFHTLYNGSLQFCTQDMGFTSVIWFEPTTLADYETYLTTNKLTP